MFKPEQVEALSANLSREHVKTRAQAGRNLSYIEGWHAIAEANRIFGYDGWTRELVETKCVSERERRIGKPPYEKEGWGVSYTARVRVTVGGVVREGVGAGHGIDADLGQAHESAIKEAETDAMKRALMTFGNPFGLALYDKTQAGVSNDAPEPATASLGAKSREAAPPPPPVSPALRKAAAVQWGTNAYNNLKNFVKREDFDRWTDGNAKAIAALREFDPGLHTKLVEGIKDRYSLLEPVNAG